MSRRTATLILALSALVLVFVAVSFLGADDPDPRADLIETARSAAPSAAPDASESPTTALPPMRMVPLPASPGAVGGPAAADPGSAGGSSASGSTGAAGGVEPARLRIPALGVDAPVVPVGLEPDGSMELPGASQAGWYEPTRIRPGDAVGSAVLAAHVDYQGQRGVFFDLRSLAEGAEVVVTAPDGTERRFRVTERFQVDKDALPLEELFRTTGDPTLTLITCGGIFDRSSRHYEDNIVVRATPI